jgi:hypothetical protein
MTMVLLLLTVILGLAQAEEVWLQVTIDDTAAKRLRAPMLVVQGTYRALFVDDGLSTGDIADDYNWVATLAMPYKKDVELELRDQQQIIGRFDVSLPNNESTGFKLKAEKDAMLAVENGVVKISSSQYEPYLGSAKAAELEPASQGRSRLRVVVDDSSERLLQRPRLLLNEKGTEMTTLQDDGELEGDIPGDFIWVGELELNRSEMVAVTLQDKGRSLSRMIVRLPAEPGAQVTARFQRKGFGEPGSDVNANVGYSGGLQVLNASSSSVEGDAPPLRGGQSQHSLRVVMDLRQRSDLNGLQVQVAGSAYPFVDDGTSGDTPGDGVHYSKLVIDAGSRPALSLQYQGTQIGSVTVNLPDSGRSELRMYATELGFVVGDHNESDAVYPVAKALGKQGRELKSGDTETGTMQLDFTISDQRNVLAKPKMELIRNGQILKSTGLSLESNGTWFGSFKLERQTGYQLQLREGGSEHSRLWLMLPDFHAAVLGLEMAEDGIATMDSFVFQGQKYEQNAPLVLHSDVKGPREISVARRTPVLISIFIDDRLYKKLGSPSARLGDLPAVSLSAVEAGLYELQAEVPYEDFVRLHILSDGELFSDGVVFLPPARQSELKLQVGLTGLRTPVHEQHSTDDEEDKPPHPMQQVSPEEEEALDEILVKLTVDDRVLQKLSKPSVVAGDGMEGVLLHDDGLNGDRLAGDQVFFCSFKVEREEYLLFSIQDKEEQIGELTVFLPSTNEANIRIRTTEEQAGLKLLTEPQALSDVDSPSSQTTIVQQGSGRLSHVLWIGIILFSIGFAFVRNTLQRRWDEEVKPLLDRLERYLDKAEGSLGRGQDGEKEVPDETAS